MTRKLSISLPEEVAKLLDDVENASAYIAEAIRQRHNRDSIDAMLARHHVAVTPDGVAAMAERLAAMDARRTARRTGEGR